MGRTVLLHCYLHFMTSLVRKVSLRSRDHVLHISKMQCIYIVKWDFFVFFITSHTSHTMSAVIPHISILEDCKVEDKKITKIKKQMKTIKLSESGYTVKVFDTYPSEFWEKTWIEIQTTNSFPFSKKRLITLCQNDKTARWPVKLLLECHERSVKNVSGRLLHLRVLGFLVPDKQCVEFLDHISLSLKR